MSINPANSDRPYFTIKVTPEGKGSVSVDLSDAVISFEFKDSEKKADLLTLKIDNNDLRFFDDPIWRKGNIIEFTFGYPGRTSPPRQCTIQSVKGGRQLTVQAHALSMLMHKVKRTRTWENYTLAEIATKIAGEYGSDLGVPGGFDKDNIFIERELDHKVSHRHQAAQTDAEFLSGLARRYGLEFYVDSRGMHFKRRNMKQRPVRVLTWFNGEGDFLDFDIENDITRKPGAFTLKGLDPLSKKVISHRADNDSTKRAGLAPVIEIIDPRTGQASLQARHAEEDIGHSTEVSATAVKAQAAGRYQQTQQTTVKLSFKIIGDPDVAGKRVIDFQGLGKRISGSYYVNEATHTIDSSGYHTAGKAHTDGHGGYGSQNVASKASLNAKDAGKKPEQIERVDPRTGVSHIEFRHSGEEPHT